jgi:tRNA A-37 threonylcarbamoyl transferase component Bud32
LEDDRLKAWQLKLLRRSVSRHSEILEYESLARTCRVIVKRLTGGWIKPEDALATVVREFESIQTVRDSLPPNLQHTVPTPLMLLPDSTALLLEKLPGKQLNVILKREANRLIGPMRKSRMGMLGRLTGEWLSQMHQATRAEPLRHDSKLFLDALDERFERFRILGIAQPSIDELRRFAGEASHKLDGHPIPASARHGDFTPQNILFDGDRLRVVDFENFCTLDAAYEDVATFVGYIQALCSFPYYSRTALQTLADSFLQAYGLNGNEAELQLYLVKSLVILISEINLEQGVLHAQKRLRLLQTQMETLCAELAIAIYAT